MPEIHVIVSDKALREAIIEAATTASIEMRPAADVTTAFKDKTASAFILDEEDVAKNSFQAFETGFAENPNRRAFILGEPDATWLNHAAVESFPKPLRLGHLLTRLQSYIRSGVKTRRTAMRCGPWRLELAQRQMVREADGRIVRLTEKETALLDYLALNEAPIGREELLAAVWGHDGRIDTHTLETHIYQLRRKLDPAGEGTAFLVNEQGAYKLKMS